MSVRVLHVSDCYLPRLGGIETQVHRLATRQRAAGVEAEVVTATPRFRHDRPGLDDVDGVPVHRAVVDLPFELPVHPRAGREVGALLRRAAASGGAFDVAHVHVGVVSPFAHLALPALVSAGIPVVVTVHSMLGPAAGVVRALARMWPPVRRHVVLTAVSTVAAAPLRPLTPTGGEVLVLPNGVDVDAWRVEPLPRPPREVVVVAVQRLAYRKRCLPLLGVLARARRLVPREVTMRAVIVGEGPMCDRMERRAARSDLAGWVDLPGRWNAAQIRDLYRRADVFVSASVRESFGIAALEARTAGVPVVARTGTGVVEFVTQDVHGLFAPDDAALAAALADLATGAELRAAMARRCRSEDPPTTWPMVLERCEKAYAEAGRRATG